MGKTVSIVIPLGGAARWIYDDVTQSLMVNLGTTTIRRASHVDVYADLSQDAKMRMTTEQAQTGLTMEGTWFADLGPVEGPVLGPFYSHDAAIRAELTWLNEHNIPTVGDKQ